MAFIGGGPPGGGGPPACGGGLLPFICWFPRKPGEGGTLFGPRPLEGTKGWKEEAFGPCCDCVCGGSVEGRTDGDGVGDGVAPPAFDRKNALTSIFGFGLSDGGGVEAAGVELVDDAGFWDIEPLPFTCPGRGVPELGMASTLPNDFTSALTADAGAVAGDEEMGADAAASSIEPKVTGEACFAAPTLPRGMLTPSLMGMLWRAALGRLECEGWNCDGAGDWERLDWEDVGGPFDQAEVPGSLVFCGTVPVDDLLIECGI